MIKDIKCSDLIPLINKKWLFAGLWQLKDTKVAEKVFDNILTKINDFGFKPKIIYEVFSIFVEKTEARLSIDGGKVVSFEIIRSLLDKMSGGKKLGDKAALMAVTIGEGVCGVGEEKFKKGEYADYFYLNGFSAALAEALTEYGHLQICTNINSPRNLSFRISPGYAVWPRLSDQKNIAGVLPLDKIGLAISETNQLIPEFSTTSMILFGTQESGRSAVHFSKGKPHQK